MALPPIVQAGSPVLRAAAAPVPAEMLGTKKLRDLAATMAEVMRKAPGVGLAAPQIGIGLALIVLEDGESLMSRLGPEEREVRGRVAFPLKVIANPVLTTHGTGRATFFEGCLSVPGYMALVERDLEVEVRGVDEKGDPVAWRVSGWPARILQHEVDHLRGTLYVDRMITRTFTANAEAPRWISMPADEVKRAVGGG
ncbi:Peptide deformylase [Minicystis rosea]|nr:Peptide deformylase [Minicystis rosea]